MVLSILAWSLFRVDSSLSFLVTACSLHCMLECSPSLLHYRFFISLIRTLANVLPSSGVSRVESTVLISVQSREIIFFYLLTGITYLFCELWHRSRRSCLFHDTGKDLHYSLLFNFYNLNFLWIRHTYIGFKLCENMQVFYDSKCTAKGRRLGQAGFTPGKPGYTMAGPLMVFSWKFSRVDSKSMNPSLHRFGLKTIGFKSY